LADVRHCFFVGLPEHSDELLALFVAEPVLEVGAEQFAFVDNVVWEQQALFQFCFHGLHEGLEEALQFGGQLQDILDLPRTHSLRKVVFALVDVALDGQDELSEVVLMQDAERVFTGYHFVELIAQVDLLVQSLKDVLRFVWRNGGRHSALFATLHEIGHVFLQLGSHSLHRLGLDAPAVLCEVDLH